MKRAMAASILAIAWLAAGSAEAGWFGKKKAPEPQHLILDGKRSTDTTIKGGRHPKKYDQWSWGRNKNVLKIREATSHPYIRGY